MNLDIYYNVDYCKLYEKIEDGEIIKFEINSEYGRIMNIFLKRKIKISNMPEYYDISTPYGYGGPIILECKNEKKLIDIYYEKLNKFCKENSIVSEFIRFHPIYNNENYFKEIYDIEFSRKTVGTNLKEFEDPVQAEFSKSMRKEIRKAIRNGVHASVIEKPKDLNDFKNLYYETMKRNNATDFYYFNDTYFDILLNKLREKILLIELRYNSEIIASELYFIEGDIMHAHLLGSNDKMMEMDAGGVLEATATNWGKENGYAYIHHGGGRTCDENDSLYLYKKKFGKNTQFDFYIGKKVWDEEAYALLCEKSDVDQEASFFPAYRRK